MINGVGSYAQASALKAPNPSFEQQNTQAQRAATNAAQPREAEIAESISAEAENDNSANLRREEEREARSASSQERGSNVDIVV